MTKEEQINQKAKELGQKYFPDENNIWARPNYEAQYVESACKEMIEWADKEVKEVDLEKELDRYTNSAEYVYNETRDSYFLVAKHFFELGLKAQKGE